MYLSHIKGLYIPDGDEIQTSTEILAINIIGTTVQPMMVNAEFIIVEKLPNDPDQPEIPQYKVKKVTPKNWLSAIYLFVVYHPGCDWIAKSANEYVTHWSIAQRFRAGLPENSHLGGLTQGGTSGHQAGQSSRPKSRLSIKTGNQGEAFENEMAQLSLSSPRTARSRTLDSPRSSSQFSAASPRARTRSSSNLSQNQGDALRTPAVRDLRAEILRSRSKKIQESEE